jgi:hypothetical protein
MTGGGQVVAEGGAEITLGGNARGTPGASDAGGHFNILNHRTDEHFEGDVTAVLDVDAANHEMTFCFTTRAGNHFTVTWRDNGEPGNASSRSSQLADKVSLAIGCADPAVSILWRVNGRDLFRGNIQWHQTR